MGLKPGLMLRLKRLSQVMVGSWFGRIILLVRISIICLFRPCWRFCEFD